MHLKQSRKQFRKLKKCGRITILGTTSSAISYKVSMSKRQKYQLTYGQAQKWVNMATKYLLVFAVIFKDMDCQEKLDSIPNFFREADAIQKLHIPLDSFIMQQYKVNNFGPWSKMNREQYEACRTQIKDKTLQDELEDWGVAANLHRADDKKSYAAYVKEQKER